MATCSAFWQCWRIRSGKVFSPRSASHASIVLGNARLYEELERRTNVLCEGLESAARDAGVPFWTNRVCAMFGLFFSSGPVTNYADATKCDVAAFKRFFNAMLARGVYLPPSQYEAAFISLAHQARDIDATVHAVEQALAEMD